MSRQPHLHLCEFDPQDYLCWKRRVDYDHGACDGALILLLGPAGAGKSHFWTEVLADRAVDVVGAVEAASAVAWNSYISLDGDEMREIHAGFREIQSQIQNRMAELMQIGESDEGYEQMPSECTDCQTASKALHEAMKPITARFKQHIISCGITESAPKGRNFSLPLTFSTPEAQEWFLQFSQAGYCVHAIVVLVAPYEVIARRVTERREQRATLQSMSRHKFDDALTQTMSLLQAVLSADSAQKLPAVPIGARLRVLLIDTSRSGSERLLADLDTVRVTDNAERAAWLERVSILLDNYKDKAKPETS